jgi:hypothetical protein
MPQNAMRSERVLLLQAGSPLLDEILRFAQNDAEKPVAPVPSSNRNADALASGTMRVSGRPRP